MGHGLTDFLTVLVADLAYSRRSNSLPPRTATSALELVGLYKAVLRVGWDDGRCGTPAACDDRDDERHISLSATSSSIRRALELSGPPSLNGYRAAP